jgi:hypothetical protein
MESIERLSELVGEKSTSMQDDEACAIIEDLDIFLKSAARQLTHRKPPVHPMRKRPADKSEESRIDRREVKRIRALLNASHSVLINKGGK